MEKNMIEKEGNREGRINIVSSLKGASGDYENFSIKIDQEGKPKLVVFEDIDKTLLHLEPTYNEIRKNMWPEAVYQDGLEEFSKVHLAGFRLGTMWRELYRIHAIYDLGKIEWKDADLYTKEFLAPGKEGENIDQEGDPYHQLSDEFLKKFDEVAAKTVEQQAKENPHFFETAKIEPMYKLNRLYKRLGVVVVGMSANPRKFVEAICKYTGLAETFIDCATDSDVAGTKEYKMEWLVDRLKNKGLTIPYDRLLVIGDSPLGDVGSASRFQSLAKSKHPEVSASGIVIIESDDDLLKVIKLLKDINDIDIKVFNCLKVPKSSDTGESELYSKDRDQYLSKI